jgi:hypothetical protein
MCECVHAWACTALCYHLDDRREESVDVQYSSKALSDAFINKSGHSGHQLCDQGREISRTLDFRLGMF